jgi:SeqA protein N-terminal domain
VPTIEIDEQVYDWLQSQVTSFGDVPNSVLRRIAGFSKAAGGSGDEASSLPSGRITARRLMDRWGLEAEQARYHRSGMFFETLTRFPAILFDASGYVRFETEAEYRNSPDMRSGKKLNVRGGIRRLRGYQRVVE